MKLDTIFLSATIACCDGKRREVSGIFNAPFASDSCKASEWSGDWDQRFCISAVSLGIVEIRLYSLQMESGHGDPFIDRQGQDGRGKSNSFGYFRQRCGRNLTVNSNA
jgi:hypothetical protein